MKVTFLEGYRPLVKVFTKDNVQAYPRVKRVTSHEFEVPLSAEGLVEKFELVKRHARHGCGMLKGELTQPLVRESRSGKTNVDGPATNIVLDIDGVRPMDLDIKPPFNANDIRIIAEYFIGWLPKCFQEVSYIAHASASLGTKVGVYSIHLDFFLSKPISVQMLKDYLLWLNFHIPGFENQLALTASGTALRYKLDRTLADNSRIIYIGHPIFDGVENPIPNDEDRLILVEKSQFAVDLTDELQSVDTAKLQRLTRNKISYLRQSAGLPLRQEKMTTARINGRMVSVVTNPDNLFMQFAYEKGAFVYYNINGGDSNAYYVYKNNPTVVYNFKGEPNFLFESADPDTYKEHIERFGFGESLSREDDDEEDTSDDDFIFPIVFRDKATDKFYTALYDPTKKQLTEVNNVGNEQRCITWMKEFGGIPPEIIPSVDYEFRPNDPRNVDMPGRFINRFVPTKLLSEPVEIPEEAQGVEYGYAANTLKDLCPTIHKVIDSIMGCGALEYEHFINWLAFIVQHKDKTMTAWVCHGVPGTGKGVFMHQVMTPILGNRHATMKTTTDIEEKFNNWLQEGLLVAIDEFNANDAKTKNLIVNKLKNAITEPVLSIREMRSDQKVVRNFCNFIFFSNDEAPIPIQARDRRYNIAPIQQVPLEERYPEITETLITEIKKEVPTFASFLLHFRIHEQMAQTALDNHAKKAMREAGQTAVDEFCSALFAGSLEYFLQILDTNDQRYFVERILPARNLLHAYLRNLYRGEYQQTIPLAEVRILYSALIGDITSDRSLGKLLNRRGIPTKRFTYRHRKMTGVDINWDIGDIDLAKLMEEYEISTEPPATFIRKDAANE